MRYLLGNLLLTISLAAPRTVVAQYVGVSVGRVSSTVDWQYGPPPPDCGNCILDAYPSASRHATTSAITVQWRATRWLGAVTELRLAPKGYAVTQPTPRVEYLQVPVLLRVGRTAGARASLRPFLEGGPALALRIRCRVFYNSTSDPCVRGAVFGQDWQLRRFDVSAIGGAGLAFHARRTIVQVGGRVDWGLRDMGGPELVPTKHRAALWYVGALMPIGPVSR